MHVIVAGGSSPTLRRAIVTACVSAGFQNTILARVSEDTTTVVEAVHGATIKYVVYKDIKGLESAVMGASVVISVLKIRGDELSLTTHLKLLRATLATATATRFVPGSLRLFMICVFLRLRDTQLIYRNITRSGRIVSSSMHWLSRPSC